MIPHTQGLAEQSFCFKSFFQSILLTLPILKHSVHAALDSELLGLM